jgi:hypothetical protein
MEKAPAPKIQGRSASSSHPFVFRAMGRVRSSRVPFPFLHHRKRLMIMIWMNG